MRFIKLLGKSLMCGFLSIIITMIVAGLFFDGSISVSGLSGLLFAVVLAGSGTFVWLGSDEITEWLARKSAAQPEQPSKPEQLSLWETKR